MTTTVTETTTTPTTTPTTTTTLFGDWRDEGRETRAGARDKAAQFLPQSMSILSLSRFFPSHLATYLD